jgi:NADH-quinone oxidoreductase B subunit
MGLNERPDQMLSGLQESERHGLTRVAYQPQSQEGWIATKLDFLVNWGRANSLWPMPFGTACCAIEFMATAASKFDLARFGMERMSFSPRQADVLICAGRVPFKLAPVIRRIWQQMPQPKWCISMGACASSGGMFDNYAVVQGIDTIIPVDVYVPGCPPRPEGLLYGIKRPIRPADCTLRHRPSTSSPSRSATRSIRRGPVCEHVAGPGRRGTGDRVSRKRRAERSGAGDASRCSPPRGRRKPVGGRAPSAVW